MSLPTQSTAQAYNVVGSPMTSATINIVPPTGTTSSEWSLYDNGVLMQSGYSITYPTITFNPAIPVGHTVTLFLNVVANRQSDFTNGSQFNATEVNKQLDKLTAFAQEGYTLSVTIANDEIANWSMPLKQSRANKALKFDNEGNPIASTYDPDEQVADAQEYATQAHASATASENSATLSNLWAESPDPITAGHYSAKYWSERSASITFADIDDNGATGEVTIGGRIVDSAGVWITYDNVNSKWYRPYIKGDVLTQTLFGYSIPLFNDFVFNNSANGYIKIPTNQIVNGVNVPTIIQWGIGSAPDSSGNFNTLLAIPFPNANHSVITTGIISPGTPAFVNITEVGLGSFAGQMTNHDGVGISGQFYFISIGF